MPPGGPGYPTIALALQTVFIKMAALGVSFLCLFITIFPYVVHGYIEGLYCGTENCYEGKCTVIVHKKCVLSKNLGADVVGCGR